VGKTRVANGFIHPIDGACYLKETKIDITFPANPCPAGLSNSVQATMIPRDKVHGRNRKNPVGGCLSGCWPRTSIRCQWQAAPRGRSAGNCGNGHAGFDSAGDANTFRTGFAVFGQV